MFYKIHKSRRPRYIKLYFLDLSTFLAPMDYKYKAESGLQLLGRLDTRPSISELENVIFDSGLNPSEVIEISGDPSSGKTLFLTQMLVKCLLPKEWNGVHVGGLNASAIIINTDHHFHIFKLVTLMGNWLLHKTNLTTSDAHSCTQSTATEEVIKAALQNLTILNCHDINQLIITFHGLERILTNNKNISLLLIDSISCYYWQNVLDRGGVRKMDLFLKKMLQTLMKHIQEFKICVFYTKPSYFQSKVKETEDSATERSFCSITKRIQLQKLESKDRTLLFYAHISSLHSKRVLQYTIQEDGIKWFDNTIDTLRPYTGQDI